MVAACGLGWVHAASASRQPTLKEREAITAALPAQLRSYPVGCVWLNIEVSNSGRYALVGPTFLNALHPPCLKYASNGEWILKKTSRWKIIYNGSGPTRCNKLLLEVPKDLITGLCLPT